jgi:hypothetical protein
MANNISYEDYIKLKPRSEAIVEACMDFGDGAEYAKKKLQKLQEANRFKGVEVYWEGTCMHFFTERIHPDIASPKRPRVMLLFSNPYPDSVSKGLFMSEKRSRRFWEMLPCSSQLGINRDFCWDNNESIRETALFLLNGDYGNRRSPLLFFECFYEIPSKSPKDLKKLFKPKTRDFDCYLRRPSLERIGRIINRYDIETILVFTRETFESITNKRVSKGSRKILRSAVQEAKGVKEVFWKRMVENELIKKAVLPNLNHDCIAIKVMDTRAKYWKTDGQSVFSCVLDYALKYAAETT